MEVNFERTVKFQFSTGDVEFDMENTSKWSIYLWRFSKAQGFGGVENSWGSGRIVGTRDSKLSQC